MSAFYLTKSWSVANPTPPQSVYIDYLNITEEPSQIGYLSCFEINDALVRMPSLGYNPADSNHVKGRLNAWFTRNYSYAWYSSVLSHCSSNPTTFVLPQRSTEKDESFAYRYGFNGQERDNEVAGKGNIMTAEYWEYDTRLGRRWNLDPVPQVIMSDYSVLGNNPNIYIDIKGDSKESRHLDKNGKVIAEYDDGDNSVYKHQTAKTKKDVDYWRAKFNNTSGNGIKIGQMSKIGLGVFDLNTFNVPFSIFQFGYPDALSVPKQAKSNVKTSKSKKQNIRGRVHLSSEFVEVSFDEGADNAVDPYTALYFSTIMEQASDEGITSINISSTTNHPSNSKNSAHSSANGARAFDMNHINGQHVSLSNKHVKILQKIIKNTPGWRENYGPLIIQKMNKGTPIHAPWARDIKGGHYDHIHVSTPLIR